MMPGVFSSSGGSSTNSLVSILYAKDSILLHEANSGEFIESICWCTAAGLVTGCIAERTLPHTDRVPDFRNPEQMIIYQQQHSDLMRRYSAIIALRSGVGERKEEKEGKVERT